MEIDFPPWVKQTKCHSRRHTIIIPGFHGIVKMHVPIVNWVAPLEMTKKLGGYS